MSVLSLRDARPETQQPGQAPRWRWLVAGIAVLALMLLAQALDVMRMPYVICGRAPAYDVLGQMEAPGGLSNRIAVENVPTYQGAGSLLQTPVWCAPAGSGLDGVVSVADAWLAGNLDVHPRSDRATADEFEREAYLMPMARAGIPLPGAGSVATVIGVRSAGHQVSLNAVVLRVDKGANERSQLKEYDNILSIAGVPVSDPDAMLAALDGTPAEESVDVTLRRAGLDHPGPIADPTERMRWHQAAGFRVVDRVDRSRRGADGCFCMFGDPYGRIGAARQAHRRLHHSAPPSRAPAMRCGLSGTGPTVRRWLRVPAPPMVRPPVTSSLPPRTASRRSAEATPARCRCADDDRAPAPGQHTGTRNGAEHLIVRPVTDRVPARSRPPCRLGSTEGPKPVGRLLS